LPARVKVINHQADRTLLTIILTEGRNRQIRRVAAQLGYPVLHLHRTKIGNISIDGDSPEGTIRQGSLSIGAHRHLQLIELRSLQSGDRD
jgi:23S rRNA pseudouridine2605 synthase